MSVIDWFFIGIITLFFVVVMFFSWSDLARDILYYKEKKKNVKSMEEHVKNNSGSNSRRNSSRNVKS